MKLLEHISQTSISHNRIAEEIPFVKLKKAYLSQVMNVTSTGEQIIFYISLDHQTVKRFLGKERNSHMDRWLEQYIFFELSSDDVSGTHRPSITILGIEKGEVWESCFEQANMRSVGLDALSYQLLDRLFKELNSESDHDDLGYVAGMVQLFVTHLFHNKLKNQFQGEGLTPRQVSKVTSFMKDHLFEAMTLEQLADQLEISQGYLCTRFKQSTGFTPFGYLNKLRMERALELLKTTDMLVIQVGMQVGIDNHAQFCRAFKKFYGQSPSQVRKQVD